MGEIPKDAVGKELLEDGKYSVHNLGMYQKNYFQGTKLLIIMLYSYGMIDMKMKDYLINILANQKKRMNVFDLL
jgi:hypothetical protein